MKKLYMIKEVVNHYHVVECDEELDIEEIIDNARDEKNRYETGYEAIEAMLKPYEEKYGFEFNVKANAEGTDCIDLTIVDEIE